MLYRENCLFISKSLAEFLIKASLLQACNFIILGANLLGLWCFQFFDSTNAKSLSSKAIKHNNDVKYREIMNLTRGLRMILFVKDNITVSEINKNLTLNFTK